MEYLPVTVDMKLLKISIPLYIGDWDDIANPDFDIGY